MREMIRSTFPSFFCKTKISFGPMNAIVVGEFSPDTSSVIVRFVSLTAGAANAEQQVNRQAAADNNNGLSRRAKKAISGDSRGI